MKKAISLLFLVAPVATAHRSDASPVNRVTNLLKDLGEKLEKDERAEEDIYENYKCWGESLITDKTKSNTAANARIKDLETYIKDISAGKVWFTQEKEEFEVEMKEIQETLEKNAAERGAEHKAFEAKANSTEKGVEGLEAGMDALLGVKLIQVDNAIMSSLRGTSRMSARRIANERLRKGLEMGKQYLSSADYAFMRDVITGHVDHKAAAALAQKRATGKRAEPAPPGSRLKSVVDKLSEIKVMMVKDLKEDKMKDDEKEEDFLKRQQLKRKEMKQAEAMLEKLKLEYAAREKAKAESQEEIDSLKKQVEADTKLIQETTKALEDKAKDWDTRLKFRQAEQEAMAKALEILNGDEARDLFRKAKPTFLQVSAQSSAQMMAAASASKALSSHAINDHRMLILAMKLARVSKGKSDRGNPSFDAVLKKIDDMKKAIKEEEAADLKKTEDCEKTRVADEATAKGHENNLQDAKDTVAYKTARIKEMDGDIAVKAQTVKDIDTDLADATKLRAKEKAEFEQSKTDDQAAITLLQKAAKVIEDFYKANSFLQMKSETEESSESEYTDLLKDTSDSEDTDDGPPATWKGDYKGAGAQSTGVVQTLKMVEEDIVKDMQVAKIEEDKAQKLFDDDKKDLEAKKKGVQDAIDALKVKKGDAANDLAEAEKDATNTQALIVNINKKMADAKPECDWYLTNYDARRDSRLTELDGLDKAKAILGGASFQEEDSLIEISSHHHRV